MLVSRTSALCSQHVFSRTFSTSTPALAIKARPPAVSLARQFEQLPFESFIPTQEESDYDTTAAGHMILHQQRQDLKYMRLIEHEMPKLVAFRKPFKAPTDTHPLVVRSIHYAGEQHPARLKRAVVVPVARLPLKDKHAIHKLKLLAGVRWSPEAPADSGLSGEEKSLEHGFIKISCEDFPRARMNMKWISDTVDRLVAEANDASEKFIDIPVDTRHIEARARKQKKGEHYSGRLGARPSIRDFPKEWLPARATA